MQNRKDIFESACLKEFAYLSEFRFQLIKREKSNYGCFLRYQNSFVALDISLVGSGIVIVFFKLQNDAIPEYPVFFDPEAEFLVFHAIDLIAVKTGKIFEQISARLFEQDYLETKVKEFASLLRMHATDIFQGDFTVLENVKQRVVHRWAELKNES
jgi:hypothetical protein